MDRVQIRTMDPKSAWNAELTRADESKVEAAETLINGNIERFRAERDKTEVVA